MYLVDVQPRRSRRRQDPRQAKFSIKKRWSMKMNYPEYQLISFKDTIPVAIKILFEIVNIVFQSVIVGI
jgi:hypothetical protein